MFKRELTSIDFDSESCEGLYEINDLSPGDGISHVWIDQVPQLSLLSFWGPVQTKQPAES